MERLSDSDTWRLGEFVKMENSHSKKKPTNFKHVLWCFLFDLLYATWLNKRTHRFDHLLNWKNNQQNDHPETPKIDHLIEEVEDEDEE